MSNSVQANHKTIFEVFHSFCFGVMKINFIKFSQRAMGPTQGSLGAAGFDLYLVEEINVLPNLAHKIESFSLGLKFLLVILGKYMNFPALQRNLLELVESLILTTEVVSTQYFLIFPISSYR